MSPFSVTSGFVDDGDTIGTAVSPGKPARPQATDSDATSPSTATTPSFVTSRVTALPASRLFALVVVGDDANFLAVHAARLR